MAVPGQLDLSFVRGDDYTLRLTFTDASNVALNLSGWSDIKAQLRQSANSTQIAAEFGVDGTNLATGIIVISLSRVVTAALAGGTMDWDLERVTAGKLQTILAGMVKVRPDVTR